MARDSRRTFVQKRAKLHQCRAVSDVVATLLMVAIVVGLGVVVFAFASGGLGSLSNNFVNLMSGSGNAVAERFVVEQVTFTTSGANQGADVYVRNVGTLATTLVSVYVVDQTSGTFVGQFTTSTAVNVGNFVDVPHNPTLVFTPTHGHTYSFTLTSSLGNSVIYNAKAA